MTTVAFDTLAYARQLRDAGVDPQIAEAQAVALAQVLKDTAGELATKSDLAGVQNALKNEMTEMKGDLTERVAKVEGRLSLVQWMLGFNLALTVAVLWMLIRSAT